MNYIFLFVAFLFSAVSVFAQGTYVAASKPIVDTAAFFNWPILEDWPAPAISNDGQFALYATRNVQVGMRNLTVQSLNGKTKIVLPEVQEVAFTADSRFTIALQSGDSLCILKLENNSRVYVTGVTGFKLFM